jgi:4-aminobutyrate aminotransferase/(S)-3-amino-2-methylpropionate transaminase
MTNNELHQRKIAAIAQGQGTLHPVYIAKARNAEYWDVEGNRYIDFGAGIGVVNTGHTHPRVAQAAIDQIQRFSHSCLMVTPYESAVALAEKLNQAVPGNTPKKTVFVTTGAEAVENAVKIARARTGRPGVIAFDGGFHGRTNFCMGLTSKVVPYKAGFGPFPADIYRAPFPIDYLGISVEAALDALQALFNTEFDPNRVAAMIVEPVQGEGGFYIAPPAFLQALRKICDRHGILLILDEIQTGFARTGRLFCTEYADIEPDMMTLAKGMAGGFPLAAVTGKAVVMDAANPGGLGGTYGGSPIACAAALAVLDVIEEEGLCARANRIGETIVDALKTAQEKHPDSIGEIRHKGAMVAMELVKAGDASQPDPERTKEIIERARDKGLILLSCGVRGNVVRVLAPLTIEDDVLREGLEILGGFFG